MSEYKPLRPAKAWENFTSTKNPEKNGPLFEQLKKIDFDLLEKCFGELLEKCGRAKDEAKLIDRDNIFMLTQPEPATQRGAYKIRTHTIELSWVNIFARGADIKKLSKQNGETECQNYEAQEFSFLWTLIHEEVHSQNQLEIVRHFNNPDNSTSPKIWRTGYMETDEEQMEKKFQLFNEGVVEITTFEILEKYIKQSGQWKKWHEQIFAKIKAGGYDSGYGDEVRFIRRLCAVLAKESGVATETVLGAIMRGAFGTDKKITEYNVWNTEHGHEQDAYSLILNQLFLDRENRLALEKGTTNRYAPNGRPQVTMNDIFEILHHEETQQVPKP